MSASSQSQPVVRTPNRWGVLVLVAVAQLMVTLDVTIVNIALPSAQRTLHFSTDSRQWLITAYALAFGSLLLVWGKLGDLFGRKWTFTGGLIGFAGASAIGGLAQSLGSWSPRERCRARLARCWRVRRWGCDGDVSWICVSSEGVWNLQRDRGQRGVGPAAARRCAHPGAVVALVFVCQPGDRDPAGEHGAAAAGQRAHPDRARIDFPGVLAGSGGLFALVYGFSNAETHSWSAPVTIIALAASVVLLIGFVWLERRVEHPLLPLHIVWDRARGGAYATIVIVGSGVFAVFLFLTFYLQQNLGFSPLTTGVAFLPMTATIVLTATTVQTRLLPRTGAKPVILAGMTVGIVAMILFTRLSVDGSYASQVLPGLILTGLGLGCIFAAAFSTGTLGVKRTEAGVASATVNTSQQIGGSVGTALLSTIFASAAASYASAHAKTAGLANAASIHGYTTEFGWAAGLFAVGLLTAALILPSDGAARAANAEAGSELAAGLENA